VRIAHVVTLLSPDNAFGGPVRVALNQLAELSRRGHDVTLYAGWKGDRPPPPSIDGVPVRAFQVRRVVPGSRFAGLHAPGLHRALRQDLPQLDAVHVHLARDLITLPAALTTLASDLPLFVQTHGMVVPSRRAILRAVDLLATRHVLRRASAVFYLTPTEREALAAVAGPDVALAELPNGVAVVEAPSTHRDSLEFLFLGRLHKTKRPEMFVRAASTVSRVLPNASFALVGPDGGEGASVKSLIAAAESTTRIRWEGALPIDRVPERLNEAAVLVLPSSYDPFPMSALEAMSAGIPTIVTEACGVADLVRTVDPRLVVGESLAELVRAMTWLGSETDRRAELGRRARDAIRATHSIAASADLLEDTYVGHLRLGARR
jgi:glycosyltransferase involved in cell wall biosynthesis